MFVLGRFWYQDVSFGIADSGHLRAKKYMDLILYIEADRRLPDAIMVVTKYFY